MLHHGQFLVRPPGTEFMKDAVPGEAYETTSVDMQNTDAPDTLGKFIGWAAGLQPVRIGKVCCEGIDLVFNLHYTSIGKATTDRSSVGLVFAKTSPKLRYVMHNGPTAANLAIPPRDGNAEIVSEMTTNVDTKLVYVQPHMHLRGKDSELRRVYPTGKTETLFKAKWDFNWQIGYDLAEPMALPKGTRIVGVAHFEFRREQSTTPTHTTVDWGDQNWEEMQNCFVGILIDPKIDAARRSRHQDRACCREDSGPTLSALQ